MDEEDAEHWFAQFEETAHTRNTVAFCRNVFLGVGFGRVKASLDAGSISPAANRAIALEWVNSIENERRAEERADEIDRAERAVQAAQASAIASKIAAR